MLGADGVGELRWTGTLEVPMPDTQQTFDSRSPADGRVVATFPIMDAAGAKFSELIRAAKYGPNG